MLNEKFEETLPKNTRAIKYLLTFYNKFTRLSYLYKNENKRYNDHNFVALLRNLNLGGSEMKYSIVYIVLSEGNVEYASTDKEAAEDFAESQRDNARQEILEEWSNDDPSEKDIYEADFQAGYDGYIYEVRKLDISNKTEDDMIELDGNEIEVSVILEKLKYSNKYI